jgi:hypothetical protein
MMVNAYNGQKSSFDPFLLPFLLHMYMLFHWKFVKENPMAGAQVKLPLQWFLFYFWSFFDIACFWLASQEDFSIKWQ